FRDGDQAERVGRADRHYRRGHRDRGDCARPGAGGLVAARLPRGRCECRQPHREETWPAGHGVTLYASHTALLSSSPHGRPGGYGVPAPARGQILAAVEHRAAAASERTLLPVTLNAPSRPSFPDPRCTLEP